MIHETDRQQEWQLSAEITSRGASFLVTVRGAVILVGVAQLVELEAGAPVTEHSRRRFDSGHQHRATSDAAHCANTLCGKYRMTNIEAAAWIGHAARKEGLGGDNDLLRRNWVSQATGHAISRYQVRPAFVCLAVSPVLHMQPGISGD